MGINAEYLTINRVHHFYCKAGFCHAKTNNILFDPVAEVRPLLSFSFLGEEVWVSPELGREILDEANTIAKQSSPATLEFFFKYFPLVDPLPPVFNQLVCFDVGFPSGMNTAIGKQEALEAFRVILGNDGRPVISL